MTRRIASSTLFLITIALTAVVATAVSAPAQTTSDDVDQLKRTVLDLRARVAALEQQAGKAGTQPALSGPSGPVAAAALASATGEVRRTNVAQPAVAPSGVVEGSTPTPVAQVLPANLPGGATLNYMLDGYYEYNFNRPPGRVNDLRAYDVLSNAFSINQADVVF